MIDINGLRDALTNPNVRAFLRVIRQGETNQTDAAYRMRYGGAFDDLSHHPDVRVYLPDGRFTTAAGAYQFTFSTWRILAGKYGFADFQPETQDLACVALIDDEAHALPDVIAGNLDVAIWRCRATWTSLPGAAESNRRWTLAKAHDLFTQYGGVISAPSVTAAPAAPAAAQPEGTMPIALILGLGQALIQAFAPLAQEKLTKVIAAHTSSPEVANQIATTLVEKAQELTGKTDAIEAVVAAKGDPNIMAQLQGNALDQLDKLMPVLDKLAEVEKGAWAAEETSRAAAGDRGLAMQAAGPLYNNPTFLVAAFVMALVAVVVFAVLFRGGFSVDMQAFVIGAIVGGALTAVLSYFLGSSRSSGAKDVLIAQLSSGRPQAPAD